ncbi:MAG: VOC family protein [Coprobacillus sp.]
MDKKMRLGYTYICVSDMEKSLDFYIKLLQQNPECINEQRWVSFNCGNTLALYNEKYDQELIDNNDISNHFNENYIHDFQETSGSTKINNIVVFNFMVDDIKSEYQRIKNLNIGAVSELMYVNITNPYWYFTIMDPDRNILEIAEMK